MNQLHVIYEGGPLHGNMDMLIIEHPTVKILKFPANDLPPGEDGRVDALVYGVQDVNLAFPPLRGYVARAVFLREERSLPGTLHGA